MSDESLASLTADIVAAHVSNNTVSVEDVGQLIKIVSSALGGIGAEAPAAAEEAKPAVSVRSSVKPEAIACLECGKKFSTIRRHITSAHELSEDAYRSKWNLPASYPMVAPNYSASRQALAKKIGLGRKPEQKAVTRKRK